MAASKAARSASARRASATRRGERVANLLELAQVEHPRRPGGTDPVRDVDPPEALGDQPAELALELADLPAQLGAGEQLVDQPTASVALWATEDSRLTTPLSSRSGMARF